MADGEVSDEERELARRAVFECLVDAGADTTFELFDVDPVVQRDYPEAYQRCLFDYAGLSRRSDAPGDAFDLGLLGIVECVEDRTGRDFGPKTIDEIGRLTPEAHQTVTAAIQAEPEVYDSCEEEIRGDAVNTVIAANITGFRLDDGDPKRISLQLEECGYIADAWLVEETPEAVVTQARTSTPTAGACWIRHPLRLKDPIGDRPIIDEMTGRTVPETGG